MSRSIQQISDRIEIEQVLAAYALAVGQRRWEFFDMIFTHDAVIDVRGTGIDFVAPPEAYREFVEHSRDETWTITQLMTGNTAFDIRESDADTFCELHSVEFLPLADDATTALEVNTEFFARDHLIRTSQGWRIQQRVVYLRGTGSREVNTTAPNIFERAAASTPDYPTVA